MMRMYWRLGCLSLTLIILLGCGARGPFYRASPAPSSNQALVYVYRPHTQFHRANPEIPILYLDDQRKARIAIGGYMAFYVDGGPHSIEVKDSMFGLPTFSEGKVSFEAAPGKTYFFRYTKSVGGVIVSVPATVIMTPHSRLRPVLNDTGVAEIRRTRRISP